MYVCNITKENAIQNISHDSLNWKELMPFISISCSLLLLIYTVTTYEWYFIERKSGQMPSFFQSLTFALLKSTEIFAFIALIQLRIRPKLGISSWTEQARFEWN